jgi:hypothetical protein
MGIGRVSRGRALHPCAHFCPPQHSFAPTQAPLQTRDAHFGEERAVANDAADDFALDEERLRREPTRDVAVRVEAWEHGVAEEAQAPRLRGGGRAGKGERPRKYEYLT